jgi:hypothetical protein
VCRPLPKQQAQGEGGKAPDQTAGHLLRKGQRLQ